MAIWKSLKFLSIIKANKLHKLSKGEFKFVEPSKLNKELSALHNEFNKHIKSKDEPTSLNELYDLFSKQPYGIKKGLIPILLASSSYTAPNGLPARFQTFRILVCLQLRLLEGQLQPLKLIWYIDTGTEVSSNLAIS